jgi:hypothetical protein
MSTPTASPFLGSAGGPGDSHTCSSSLAIRPWPWESQATWAESSTIKYFTLYALAPTPRWSNPQLQPSFLLHGDPHHEDAPGPVRRAKQKSGPDLLKSQAVGLSMLNIF